MQLSLKRSYTSYLSCFYHILICFIYFYSLFSLVINNFHFFNLLFKFHCISFYEYIHIYFFLCLHFSLHLYVLSFVFFLIFFYLNFLYWLVFPDIKTRSYSFRFLLYFIQFITYIINDFLEHFPLWCTPIALSFIRLLPYNKQTS